MPYQHSRPDQESDREPSEPGCITESRWRNRRRWFYVTVVAATLACLGGGWVWWYRAGFPIPSEPNNRHLFEIWEKALDRKLDLGAWIERRETKHIELAGTIWEDAAFGATIEFTPEGLFYWRKAPWNRSNETALSYPASLDGQPWRFLREVPPKRIFGGPGFNYKEEPTSGAINPPNLKFPESDGSAHLLFDGSVLYFTFGDPEWINWHPFPLVFTRQPSP